MGLLDFGQHTIYVMMAYGVSAITVGVLIFMRRRRLTKAIEPERSDKNNL